jgi:16S rRNA (cytosine967-C5)-methyltransferase
MPSTDDNSRSASVSSARTPETDPRAAAFRILLRVERAGAWASVLLDREEARLADRRDVGLLHALVLGVLRERAVVDHVLATSSSRPIDALDADVRTALRIGAYSLLRLDRVPDHAAVDRAVRLVVGSRRGAAGFVNAVLRAVAREGAAALPAPPASGDVDSLARFRSHPPWWVRRLVDRVGWERADAILESDNLPASVVLHAHPKRGGRDAVALRLQEEGIRTDPCRIAPRGLAVVSGRIAGSAAIVTGDAWVQDEAAQLVTELFPPEPWQRAADWCAAPGGKTMQLATTAPEGAFVVACDRHLGRLRKVAENLRRVDAVAAAPVNADMASAPPVGPRFDRILVDAPCSGTGTLRRHPEIRWRLEPGDLKLLAARQLRLLASAAERLAPGGWLVYSVCSLEPEEGEQVVRRLVTTRSDLRLVDPTHARPVLGSHLAASGELRTSPEDGMDGFYAALLRRVGRT